MGWLLHVGAELCVSVALALVLALGVELTIRLRAYSQWLAYALCSKCNTVGYIRACVDFIGIPDGPLPEVRARDFTVGTGL